MNWYMYVYLLSVTYETHKTPFELNIYIIYEQLCNNRSLFMSLIISSIENEFLNKFDNCSYNNIYYTCI